MSLGTILLIVLILMLVGALPTWPHSASWVYRPVGGLSLLLVVVLALLVMGRLWRTRRPEVTRALLQATKSHYRMGRVAG
jgi:membrane protein implicated in regulation of membrane protease activity